MNKSQNQPIEYLVNYASIARQHDACTAFKERIATFNPIYFNTIPFVSVRIKPDDEERFKQTLDAIVGVTYRLGERHQAFTYDADKCKHGEDRI